MADGSTAARVSIHPPRGSAGVQAARSCSRVLWSAVAGRLRRIGQAHEFTESEDGRARSAKVAHACPDPVAVRRTGPVG
jgi:hypothetical protein